MGDLVHLTGSGMAEAIRAAAANGTWILGLCGGYQMLGATLQDDKGSEGGPGRFAGLDLLPIATVFETEKVVQESRVASLWPAAGYLLEGYEIHHGRTTLCASRGEALAQGGAAAGWRHERALGTCLHGILGNDAWRSAFLNEVRRTRGFPAQAVQTSDPIEQRIQRWAEHCRRHLREGAWERIVGVLGRCDPISYAE